MATCKDCVHYECCQWLADLLRKLGFGVEFDDNVSVEKTCDHFKNKADIAEVKHGKWEWFANNSKTRTCSNCHISQTVNVFKDKVMFNYCPYCGADMRKVIE